MTLTIQPWDKWEDYAAGLYRHRPSTRGIWVQESVKLLSAADVFGEVAREMVSAWPHAAAHNLNLPSGRRAWIGQASCCYHHGATAEETAQAWGRLSNRTQIRANRVASAVIDEYLNGGRHGAEALFAG